jgi:hypothetical protein
MAGKQPALKHGHTWKDPVTGEARVSPTYKSWQAMKYRCQRRADYMALGITICPRWLSFDNFLEDMSERPSRDHSIDRIDTYGGYWCGHCDWCKANKRPSNCRWTTRSVQQGNRRPMPDQPNQYSTGKAVIRVNECGHPDRPHSANGMCSACYQRDWKLRQAG